MTTKHEDRDREAETDCGAAGMTESGAATAGSDWPAAGPVRPPSGHPPGHSPGQLEGEGEGGDVAISEEVEEGRPQLKEPSKYAVVLHNDDYTTMDFVVEVLQRFFQKTGDEAVRIMLKVHQDGRGVAGVYSFEIAETKSVQVNDFAQSRGFPLKSTVEEAT